MGTTVATIITQAVGNGIGSDAFVIRPDGEALQGRNTSGGVLQD
ncbi:hypothetical protein [Polaromonas sp. CG9_12]|nr:hypothetical protein [Polaromonas sp. CG9_12]